jgi:hypothetical protein
MMVDAKDAIAHTAAAPASVGSATAALAGVTRARSAILRHDQIRIHKRPISRGPASQRPVQIKTRKAPPLSCIRRVSASGKPLSVPRSALRPPFTLGSLERSITFVCNDEKKTMMPTIFAMAVAALIFWPFPGLRRPHRSRRWQASRSTTTAILTQVWWGRRCWRGRWGRLHCRRVWRQFHC